MSESQTIQKERWYYPGSPKGDGLEIQADVRAKPYRSAPRSCNPGFEEIPEPESERCFDPTLFLERL